MKIMAKKSGNRLVQKEAKTQNRKQDILSDEITLRDEILELKRQVMTLKRTNEQYTVKLRKYEDEAKRKDKQLEQLMDPRKNSDITKVLSTKGAAILMNLKDRNNALIQMILNKDLHIRRLMAEIKMSKLYASTKKNEDYRAEISRLRNLLIKSQETLKENVDFSEQSRSICVSGNSFLEFSSSSDQSTPRDLDELRLTIMGLESHIQNSNDLLTKKNQEISLLRDEINFLKKFWRNKTFKSKFYNCEPTQGKNYELSTADLTSKQPEVFVSSKIFNHDLIDLFQKSQDETSTQNVHKKWTSSFDSIPQYNFHSYVSEEATELIGTEDKNIERVNKACSLMGKSLFHHLAADEIKREEKTLTNPKSTTYAKEKWKRALNKYKELKQLNPQMFSSSVQVKKVYLKYENKETGFSDYEKKIQNTINITRIEVEKNGRINAQDQLDISNSSELFKKENENIPETPQGSGGNVSNNEANSEICRSSEKESNEDDNYETEYVSGEETQIEEEAQHTESQSPKDIQKSNNVNITKYSCTTEEAEPKYTKPFQENYSYGLDSSFDSDYDYSVKQEIHQVQVEVQINSVSSQSDKSLNNISETNQFHEYDRENNGNLTPELDFNDDDDDDDDDVIIREK